MSRRRIAVLAVALCAAAPAGLAAQALADGPDLTAEDVPTVVAPTPAADQAEVVATITAVAAEAGDESS